MMKTYHTDAMNTSTPVYYDHRLWIRMIHLQTVVALQQSNGFSIE